MRGRRSLLRIGVALLVAGVGWMVASALTGGTGPEPLPGPDRPVNRGARDPGDLRAHNSPTVTRSPRDRARLVITSRTDSPDFSCAVHTSGDDGISWVPVAVPVPRGYGPKCYAPDATFAADGVLHVSYVTLIGRANQPEAVWVASSKDGGRTLSEPRRVSGALAFQVRVAADPARPERLFATWLQARDIGSLKFTAPGNPIVVSRSDDGGATWSTPVRANDPDRGRAVAPSAAVGRRGELYVLYLDVGEDRLDYEGAHENVGGPPFSGRFSLVLARSLDRGRTWAESVVDDGVVPTERFIPFLAPFPSLAVDRGSGRIYVGFHDSRLGTPDVWVWTLPWRGKAWSRPVRVNDTAKRDRTAQYLPALAVAPDGRLDVVYYDRRADRRRNVRNEVSLQSSQDDGRSFGARSKLSSRSFDSRIGFGSARELATLGSRLGLISGDDELLAVWSDTSAGTQASGKQDLVRAVVAVDSRSRLRVLRYGGLALTLLGSGMLAVALRRRAQSTSDHLSARNT